MKINKKYKNIEIKQTDFKICTQYLKNNNADKIKNL